MKQMIIPAIISNDNIELNDALKKAKLVSNFAQIDVMDGEFVENKSNFFNLKIDDISLHLEAHLMVNEPYLWIKKNIKKFDTILTPIETTKNIEQVISFVKEHKKRIGIVINPETSVDSIKDYIFKVDQVLVMTVHPGKYGAEFLPNTLKKVKEIRALLKTIDIEVDGGITPSTIAIAKDAGANRFVCGSFLMKSYDVKRSYDVLKKSIKND